MSLAATRAQQIKQWAAELDFMACGIAQAEFLEDEAPRLEQWLHQQRHGQMHYMARHFDKRLDPRRLVEGARSVVSLLFNYYPERDLAAADPDNYKVSKYAYGEDYHFVVKDRLKTLLGRIRAEIGEVGGRAFVDSAPVMDKAWAARSGLGWVGKNTNLIRPGAGSFFFVAELILDLELAPDGPIPDYCGTCTRCLDACPTDALTAPYQIDGSKCISYFTIELKEAIPQEVAGQFAEWIFGCDICQDVCPWNRFARPHREPALDPPPALAQMKKSDWEDITAEVFQQVFRRSAVKRAKLAGLQRNIAFVRGAAIENPPKREAPGD